MVKIVSEKGEVDLDVDNPKFSETLTGLILQNFPVLIEGMCHDTASRNIYPTLERTLFFSNGNVKGLAIAPRLVGGKTVIARASHASEKTDWGMRGYWLGVHSNKESEPPKVVRPYSHMRTEFNEGTFSPAGGVSWGAFSNGGTMRLLIGKPVVEQYGAELRAINFAERGLCFDLPPFYSMPGYLIQQKGKNNQEKTKLEIESSHLACISASRNLLIEAARIVNAKDRSRAPVMNEELSVTQVGFWSRGYKMFADKGHPVSDEDYAIAELMHPSRLVGFIKVGRGGQYGRTFVYPTELARDVFELAFSNDFVSQYFPEGNVRK